MLCGLFRQHFLSYLRLKATVCRTLQNNFMLSASSLLATGFVSPVPFTTKKWTSNSMPSSGKALKSYSKWSGWKPQTTSLLPCHMLHYAVALEFVPQARQKLFPSENVQQRTRQFCSRGLCCWRQMAACLRKLGASKSYVINSKWACSPQHLHQPCASQFYRTLRSTSYIFVSELLTQVNSARNFNSQNETDTQTDCESSSPSKRCANKYSTFAIVKYGKVKWKCW